MALDRIPASALRAQTRALDNVAHNTSQLSVRDAQVVRTRFESEAPPPRGPGGMRAETVPLAPRAASSPVLSPELDEGLVRNDVDIAQELTTALVARRAFQANVAVHRAADDLFKAAINLGA